MVVRAGGLAGEGEKQLEDIEALREWIPRELRSYLRREQADPTVLRHAQFVRDGIASLKSKKLSTGQYFCWSLSPPAVTIVTKDGQRHSLRGPVDGGTWGPQHLSLIHI